MFSSGSAPLEYSDSQSTVISPSASLVGDEDGAGITSPRKNAFGIDSTLSALGLKKKKPPPPAAPATANTAGKEPQKDKGIAKITNVILGKQPSKENKTLSKEGQLKLQVEQQEARRNREQDYQRQLEIIKSQRTSLFEDGLTL